MPFEIIIMSNSANDSYGDNHYDSAILKILICLMHTMNINISDEMHIWQSGMCFHHSSQEHDFETDATKILK